MPTQTFRNLSAEKQRRILDAAIAEFCTHTFTDASINQIVKAADIPKGSFYQYFTGKEDVFLCVLQDIARQTATIPPDDTVSEPVADVFDAIMRDTKRQLGVARVNPLFVQAAVLMELDYSEFITSLRKLSARRYVDLVERDKREGRIRPDVDAETLIDLISTFSLAQYQRSGPSAEQYLNKLDAVLSIIKRGVTSGRS